MIKLSSWLLPLELSVQLKARELVFTVVVTKFEGAEGEESYMVTDKVWFTELKLNVLELVAQVEVGEAVRIKGLKPPLVWLIDELVMVKACK